MCTLFTGSAVSLQTPAAQKEDGERDAAERRHRTYLSESQKTKPFLLRHISAVSRERVGVCEYCSVLEREAKQGGAKNFSNNQVNLSEGKKQKKKTFNFLCGRSIRFPLR